MKLPIQFWRPILILVGVFVMTAVGIVLFVYGYHCALQPTNGVRVQELKGDAAKRIPVGTSCEQVEKWFAFWRLKATPQIDPKTGQLYGYRAEIPNDSLLESADIRIHIYFDEKGRLQDSSIARIVYGP